MQKLCPKHRVHFRAFEAKVPDVLTLILTTLAGRQGRRPYSEEAAHFAETRGPSRNLYVPGIYQILPSYEFSGREKSSKIQREWI